MGEPDENPNHFGTKPASIPGFHNFGLINLRLNPSGDFFQSQAVTSYPPRSDEIR